MKRFFTIAGLVAFSIAVLCALSSHKESDGNNGEIPQKSSGYDEGKPLTDARNFAPALPEKAFFCGEEIDLTNYYLRERFDRELLSFTYWHSQIFLMIKRANKLFPIIEPILKQEGVPDDFKYLAMIESNLDPRALSAAKAAGIWQILPETAKDAGLEVNDAVDERYNLEKSTVLACKYLKRTYELTGSWSAAAASYNTGRARVLRQIDTQKTSNYFDMLFSEETNRYVFRIILAKSIMENPQKYGFYLKRGELYGMPKSTVLTVDTTIANLTDFAIANGSNYQLLKDANPWLRSNTLTNKTHKTYKIKIVTKQDARFKASDVKVHNSKWVVD